MYLEIQEKKHHRKRKEQTSCKNIVVEVLDDYPRTKDALVAYLNKNRVLVRARYYPPLHTKTCEYDVRIAPCQIPIKCPKIEKQKNAHLFKHFKKPTYFAKMYRFNRK